MKKAQKHALSLLLFTVFAGIVFSQNKRGYGFGPNLETLVEVETFTNFSPAYITYTDPVTNREEKYFSTADTPTQLRFVFKKSIPQNIQLVIGDQVFTILISPGEHLSIKYRDQSNEPLLEFLGDKTAFHRVFQQLYNDLKEFDLSQTVILAGGEGLEPEAYSSRVASYKVKWLEALEYHIQKYGAPVPIVDWFRGFIEYNTANHLFEYGWERRKQIAGASFWNFFEQVLQHKEAGITSSNRYQFYTNYFVYLANMERLFMEEMSFYGQDWAAYYTGHIHKLGQVLSGLDFDILTAHLLYQFIIDDFQTFKSDGVALIDKIGHPFVRENIKEKWNALKKQMANTPANSEIKIYDYRRDTSSADPFELLLERYRGSIIYIDIWASWCGPCRAEMPHSRDLQQAFKDENVTFVSLCQADAQPNKRAKAIISENELPGEHYLMNYPQTTSINNRLSVRGIPRYLIIDQQGEIVDSDAPKPSSEAIRKKLRSLLGE